MLRDSDRWPAALVNGQEGIGLVGVACVGAAIVFLFAFVAIFRADAGKGSRGAGALIVMTALGILMPLLLLAGLWLVAISESGTWGR